jgi:hypothetical protein
MSERKAGTFPFSSDIFTFPLVMARAGFEMGLVASVSLARMTQVAFQSADTALAKYVELTEQEIKRGQRHETVKVE